MVSCTTRPPRVNEEDGVDYYFLDDAKFKKLLEQKRFIEHTHFRGWRYGVEFDEAKSGYINIGVFNVEGLNSLLKSKYRYHIIPIYLEEKLSVRLRRSRDREGRWRWEYFRRAWTDYIEFKGVKKTLAYFNNGKYIYLKQENGVWRQSQIVYNALLRWGVLIKDKETKKIRLGNFV